MNIKGMSYTNERHLRCQKVADAACSDAAFFGSKRYGVCRICQLGTCRATVVRRDAVGRNHRCCDSSAGANQFAGTAQQN